MPSFDISKLKIFQEQRHSYANQNSSKKKLLISISTIVAIIILFFIFSNSEIEVETVPVSQISSTQSHSLLSASGYVIAERKAAIASKATGRLIQLNVEEGDVVKKNEVIGRLEFTDVEAYLNQGKSQQKAAIAQLNQAEIELKRIEKIFERTKKLYKSNLISSEEFETIEGQFNNANANVNLANANVESANANANVLETQLENTFIRAPFDGTVLNKNAEVGEIVAPMAASLNSKSAVVTIADMSSIEVEADVSESNIGKVKVGLPCEITLDAIPDFKYNGYVHKIVPTADRSKATVLTKIRFETYDNRVLPEMSAKISFLDTINQNQTSQESYTTIPQNAVLKIDGKDIVYTVKNGIANSCEIVLGKNLGTYYEVISGVNIGDEIIVSPSEKIKNGSKIKIKQL